MPVAAIIEYTKDEERISIPASSAADKEVLPVNTGLGGGGAGYLQTVEITEASTANLMMRVINGIQPLPSPSQVEQESQPGAFAVRAPRYGGESTLQETTVTDLPPVILRSRM